MKTLYLIRHAKSSWDNLDIQDFDRPLNERGKDDLKLIWWFLSEKNIYPDVIFSSPAKRAKKTIKWICEYISFPAKEVIFERDIYENHMKSIDYYLAFLMDISNKFNKVFLVWHNPFITDLSEFLTWLDVWNIPTCSVVSIKLEIDNWKDLSYEKGKIDFFVYPKILKY